MVVFDPHASLAFLDRHPGLGTIASALSAAIGALGLVATIVSIYIPANSKTRKYIHTTKQRAPSKGRKRRR